MYTYMQLYFLKNTNETPFKICLKIFQFGLKFPFTVESINIIIIIIIIKHLYSAFQTLGVMYQKRFTIKVYNNESNR